MTVDVGTMTRKSLKPEGGHESGITLSALRTFVAIVDAGSFSKAAAALGVSQPSVSIQLNSLERACRVLLLHRRPRLELTDAGRDLFVRARLIISRLEEFEGSVNELRELRRGHLSVGLSGPHVAMPLIGSFVEQNPALTLSTRIGNTSALLADVAQCRIDVGIVAMMDTVPALSCTKVVELQLVVCVRSGDPLAKRRTTRPREIASRRLIMREEGSFTRQITERAFHAAGVEPMVRMEVVGREAMKEAIVAGLGIGVLFAQETAGDSRLGSVELAGAPRSAAIYAVTLAESLEIPVVRAFIEHVKAKAPPRK